MALNKVFSKIKWSNDGPPAIDEDSLNRIEDAIDAIDDRVIEIDDRIPSGTQTDSINVSNLSGWSHKEEYYSEDLPFKFNFTSSAEGDGTVIVDVEGKEALRQMITQGDNTITLTDIFIDKTLDRQITKDFNAKVVVIDSVGNNRIIPLTFHIMSNDTWAKADVPTIIEMLEDHYSGKINIYDYWHVGDKRAVTLSAMPATYDRNVQPVQTHDFILVNKGGKKLADGVTDCAFIVHQRWTVVNSGYMNASRTNVGGWKECDKRKWCNEIYRNAIPESIRPIFKQHINLTQKGGNIRELEAVVDYFALPVEYNLTGGSWGAQPGEDTVRWEYYLPDNPWGKTWEVYGRNEYGIEAAARWMRSPVIDNKIGFVGMSGYGSMASYAADNPDRDLRAAPFGVI